MCHACVCMGRCYHKLGTHTCPPRLALCMPLLLLLLLLQKLEWQNGWQEPRTFKVVCSSPHLVEVENPEFELGPAEQGHIQLTFLAQARLPVGMSLVWLHVRDESHALIESMALQLQWTGM